ncbi:DUF937 domain-containing protein [Mesorhizobium sp. SP-1A]|uniref:DUF937 domain-containing protein n=1 Tax=Mesorhizobium sp. SP-1A TaxID=3077840 RepID=UPI0028F6DE14|nr:DUF937 domain-containing protein [Mesorhizobium sp. SP-1A]
MLSLFDMLAQAQNGQGIEALARQFNLSQQQAQAAVDALLPAFSQGLKQNAADPYGLGAFMNAMASGSHAKYFEDAGKAFTPQGVQQGNDVLGQIFGSKDLSRAVAAQAAQATGLGQQLLQQMLPVIASMIMGGLFKQSTGQVPGSRAQPGGFGDNPLGQILEQMMKQAGGMAGAPQQQPQTPQNPSPQNPFGDNPWGKILEQMLGGGQEDTPPPSGRQPEPNPSGRPKTPYDDIFGKMFETGRQQRDDYQKGVESIFDQFRQGMDRSR